MGGMGADALAAAKCRGVAPMAPLADSMAGSLSRMMARMGTCPASAALCAGVLRTSLVVHMSSGSVVMR